MGRFCQCAGVFAADLCQGLCDGGDKRRFVAAVFVSLRSRHQVRGIGFDQQAVFGDPGDQFPQLCAAIFQGYDAGNPDTEAHFKVDVQLLCRAGKTVDHTGLPAGRFRSQDFDQPASAVALVQDHRQVEML